MGEKYDGKQTLGSYRTSDVQFPNPEGCKVFTGYGADASDLERGFIRPTLPELPNYDKDNYVDRYTQPRESDITEQGPGLSSDFEFRQKERESKGFLTRPYIPTER